MSPDFNRRLSIFKTNRKAVIALYVMILLLMSGLGAERISNSSPIVGQIRGKLIVPAYFQYNREVLGLEGAGVIDYRELRNEFDWAVWPLLNWHRCACRPPLSGHPSAASCTEVVNGTSDPLGRAIADSHVGCRRFSGPVF